MIVFSSAYLLFPEVYPTTMRNVGYGVVCTVGKIGSIVAPFVGIMVERAHSRNTVLSLAGVVQSGSSTGHLRCTVTDGGSGLSGRARNKWPTSTGGYW
jgi:hypothetical protein